MAVLPSSSRLESMCEVYNVLDMKAGRDIIGANAMTPQHMTRRMLLASAGALIPDARGGPPNRDPDAISRQRKRLAIAMWDFSWILRHHRGGEFEDWDQALDGLAERGYNAIRIDAMPHLVAPNGEGKIVEECYFPRETWVPALWGNEYSVRVQPREALLEFLPKCHRRGFHVGLATWFTSPLKRFTTEDGLFRAWDGTLQFLQRNNLLKRVLYVDVLNEYPNVHGFDWLKDELKQRSEARKFQESHPDARLQPSDFAEKKGRYSALQKRFFNKFLKIWLGRLRERWPRFDFHASLDSATQVDEIDLANLDALDYHIWFQHNREMRVTNLGQLITGSNDQHIEEIGANVKSFWAANRARMIEWMAGRIRDISASAARRGIPCGNTEGWGPIGWMDHPALDWDWVKESAEICVDLAIRNNYRFICTSNFTHPQFRGLWRDVKWHRKMTARIRG